MKNRKGYFDISKQRKKSRVKMAFEDLWKQMKKKDRSRGERTDEGDKYNFGANYDRSRQFWSSFSRIKATATTTNDRDERSMSLPFLEDSKNKDNDVRDKKDLSNSDNTGKMLKCSNKENKKVHADTTSEMVLKLSSHDAKHRVSNSQICMRNIKFEQKMNERRKLLLSKYKIGRKNHEPINKGRYTSNNANEITLVSNETNKMQIPVQINKEKLQISSEVGLSETEVNKNKNSYYESETMEADSTVPNDKKDDIHTYNDKNISKSKDVSQHELCRSITANKLQDNFNAPTVVNQNYLNKIERKRKRIKQKFRFYFDECLTISEEEEEESILDSCMYKKRKKDFNGTLNESTNVESRTALDMTLSQTETQDTTTNLVICEDITNNIVSTETFKITKVKQIEAVSSITSAVECNRIKTASDNDVFALQNESPIDKNVHIEETAKSTLLDNDEQIQTNLSNELQIKIVDYSSENHLFNSETNVEKNCVEESSTFKKSIDTEGNVLPDSNINNDNCNDTSIKVLTNYAIKIRTSSEKSSSNNNFDKITCHVSQNSYIKESEVNTNSDNSGTAAKVLNSTLDSASLVEEMVEISKNTDNQSKTVQDHVPIDMTEKRESIMVANINFTESHTKNINDSSVDIQIKVRPYTETSKCTLRNSEMSLPEAVKQCTKNISEDLSQLLEIDVNHNHRIQSNGNTISIQEDLEKVSNQYIMVKDTEISDVTNKANEMSSEHSAIKTKERLLEKYSTMVMDIGLTDDNTCNVQNKDDADIQILSGEEATEITSDNTVDNISPIVSDTSKQHTLLDCNTKNVNNFKQPETIQPNKIRVLSSAELGSRWCPTPVNNSTSSSATDCEPKLSSDTVMELLNNNQPCKDSTESIKFNLNLIPDNVQLTLSYIYNIMMRIRSIEKKYLLNNCQDISTDNQKKLSNDEQFKSNFTVLLQEFVNLATELKILDIDKVVQYAILMINKHYMQSNCETITIHELSRYMRVLNPTPSQSAVPNSDVSVFNEQGTNLDSIQTATIKPIPSVSNNSNVVPPTLSFVPNLYVPIVSQGHIVSNNLPKQNIYVSNVSNQNYEHNISNVQAMQKPNASISYIPSVQQTYQNMQLLPENRTSSINTPYYQPSIQQQSIPVVAINNVPNANIMQLKNNVHVVQTMNMHKKPQEGLISNKPELLIGQSNTLQRLPQQSMSHNIPQVSQKPQGTQIYIAQNSKNTQVSSSTTLPMHSSNLLPGTNAISHELIFKIWDQLTYCLEQKIVDYRLHNKTYCFLQSFYEKWKRPMNNFMYQRMRTPYSELIPLHSHKAKLMYYVLRGEKLKQDQLLWKNKELQHQSLLMNILNKTVKRKNLESPVNVNTRNETVQPEVTQYKSRKHKKKVKHEKQQQSQDQSNLHLLNNMVVSVSDEVLNASENNNSLLVESNFINSDNTMVLSHKKDNVENVNVTTSTSLEQKTEKQQNMLETNEVTSSENDDIQIIEDIHRKEECLSFKQTIGEKVVHVQEESSLPEQTITKVVHVQEESSLPEQIITEVVHVQEESSLPEQTIREVVHMQEENSLPKETITEKIVYVQEESSLPEQIITEVVHVQEESSLPEQTIREVVHIQEGSLLPKRTITEEIIYVQEESSLPEQTITEVVHMKKKSLLPEQTIGEAVHEKEQSSLIEQIIKDNNNYLQCDSIQSVTLLDPHIVDVRSISLTSFNKMEDAFALNDAQLPSSKDTENNEIKVKIEIPEDIICLQCSKASTVVCEVCIGAHYCSKECAELHWVSEHHKNCKPFNSETSEKSDNDAPTTEDIDCDNNHTNVP